MHILVKTFIIVFGLATVSAELFLGRALALGLGVGYATMAINLWLTRRTVRQFTSGGRTKIIGLYVLKMTAFFGLLYWFLKVLELNVFGLVIGLSLPLTVMVFAGNRWMSAEEDTGDPVESGV